MIKCKNCKKCDFTLSLNANQDLKNGNFELLELSELNDKILFYCNSCHIENYFDFDEYINSLEESENNQKKEFLLYGYTDQNPNCIIFDINENLGILKKIKEMLESLSYGNIEEFSDEKQKETRDILSDLGEMSVCVFNDDDNAYSDYIPKIRGLKIIESITTEF